MAFKCEICKTQDAKRQFIGSVLTGSPVKELYICNDCFEKLTPSLTLKSLEPILQYQLDLAEQHKMPIDKFISTQLAMAVLNIYDTLTRRLSDGISKFFAHDALMGIRFNGATRDKDEVYALSFGKPFEQDGIKVFPFMLDDNVINVYMSIDPNNPGELINVIHPDVAKHFAPGFSYIGLGFDEGDFDALDFFDCVCHASDVIDKFCDKYVCSLTASSITAITEKKKTSKTRSTKKPRSKKDNTKTTNKSVDDMSTASKKTTKKTIKKPTKRKKPDEQ